MSQVPLGKRTPRSSPSISQALYFWEGLFCNQCGYSRDLSSRSTLPTPHVVPHASLRSTLKRLSSIKCVPGLAHRGKKKKDPYFLRVMPLDPRPHEERKKGSDTYLFLQSGWEPVP